MRRCTLECDTGRGPARAAGGAARGPAGRADHRRQPPAGLGPDRDPRHLPGGIGYFALSSFVNPVYVMGEFGKAVERFREAPGLVVDLRGNQGGAFNIVMGMLGWLVPDRDRQVGHGRPAEPDAEDRRAAATVTVRRPRGGAGGRPVDVRVGGVGGGAAGHGPGADLRQPDGRRGARLDGRAAAQRRSVSVRLRRTTSR